MQMKAASKMISRIVQVATMMSLAVNAPAAQTPTGRNVSTANAFLSSLDQAQRSRVVFAFNDDKQRARWSNFPTGIFPRAGLKVGDMTAARRAAAMTLLSSALSRRCTRRCSRSWKLTMCSGRRRATVCCSGRLPHPGSAVGNAVHAAVRETSRKLGIWVRENA
jgi:Protein of unknown function (DUF3500)